MQESQSGKAHWYSDANLFEEKLHDQVYLDTLVNRRVLEANLGQFRNEKSLKVESKRSHDGFRDGVILAPIVFFVQNFLSVFLKLSS